MARAVRAYDSNEFEPDVDASSPRDSDGRGRNLACSFWRIVKAGLLRRVGRDPRVEAYGVDLRDVTIAFRDARVALMAHVLD